MSIRAKLLASFMLVAGFTGVLGVNAVATVNRLNDSRDAQYAAGYNSTRLLVDWLNQARLGEGDLAEFMFQPDPVARTTLRAEMTAADANLADLEVRPKTRQLGGMTAELRLIDWPRGAATECLHAFRPPL